MTPATCLSAIVTQLQGITGMNESRSPKGVRNSPGTRIDRAWSVTPKGLSPSTAAGRGRVDTSGIRISQRFTIEIAHTLAPSKGQAAPNQSLLDLHTVIKALVAPGTSLTTTGVPDVKTVTAEALSGGAYLLHSLSLEVTYPLALI